MKLIEILQEITFPNLVKQVVKDIKTHIQKRWFDAGESFNDGGIYERFGNELDNANHPKDIIQAIINYSNTYTNSPIENMRYYSDILEEFNKNIPNFKKYIK